MGFGRRGRAIGVAVACLNALAACGRASSDEDAAAQGGRVDASGGAESAGGILGAGGVIAMGGVTASGATSAGGASSGGTSFGGTTSGGASSGGQGGAGGATETTAPRLIVFYTRWGTHYPDWWPENEPGEPLLLKPMLEPLQPYADQLTLINGLANVAPFDGELRPTSMPGGSAAASLFTAQPIEAVPATRDTPTRSAPLGPSLDVAIGDCGGRDGPPIRLRVGDFQEGEGLFWDESRRELASEPDPRAAAQRLLGESVDAPDPALSIDDTYGPIGRAQIDVLVRALAARKACVATLSWGDAVVPKEAVPAGPSGDVHELSHYAPSIYGMTAGPELGTSPFKDLQRWYATQFALLLQRLKATQFEGGTLFEKSVVLWISETGAGSDHTGRSIPVILAGGALESAGYLNLHSVTQFHELDIERTQGDLMSALARIWGIADFGAPEVARDAIDEIRAR